MQIRVIKSSKKPNIPLHIFTSSDDLEKTQVSLGNLYLIKINEYCWSRDYLI